MIERVDDSHSELLTDMNREEKLKWLMKTYGNDVVRIAFSYLKQKQLAEDVAQEVFIKCYEKMDTFRNDSSYKTWLIRITVNRCKDVMKSRYFKNLFMMDYSISNYANSSLQLHDVEKEDSGISQSIVKLPIKLREVIILFYYQDLTIDEISSLLKVKPNTVKTRLHRARIKLKESFEGGGVINEK